MNAKAFFNTVKAMREMQKRYFKYRSQDILKESKRLESIIDKEIERVDNIIKEQSNPRLF